jgi:hypothetical protein
MMRRIHASPDSSQATETTHHSVNFTVMRHEIRDAGRGIQNPTSPVCDSGFVLGMVARWARTIESRQSTTSPGAATSRRRVTVAGELASSTGRKLFAISFATGGISMSLAQRGSFAASNAAGTPGVCYLREIYRPGRNGGRGLRMTGGGL